MGTTARSFLKAAYSLCGAAIVLAAAPSQAAITVADSPLFLTVTVAPNIVVTLDDSGSMRRAYVPDLCGANGTTVCETLHERYAKSSYFNPLYYNPNVKYPAAKNADGTDRTTSFTAAYINGFDQTLNTRNLSNRYRPTASLQLTGNTATELFSNHYSGDLNCDTSARVCRIGTTAAGRGSLACSNNRTCQDNDDSDRYPAYYYVFNPLNSGCDRTATDRDCYTLTIVTATSGPATVDLNGDGVVNAADADERQNFANWFSFARTRNLATQTATSLAFSTLGEDVRVGWQALNTCHGDNNNFVDTDCDGWRNNFTNKSNAIGNFTGQKKLDFYAWLSQLPTNDGTPLPEAMRRVGEYYKTSGDGSPYDNDLTPNTPNSGELSCRRNYHVMMTDGIWNGANSGVGNKDNTSTTLPQTVSGIAAYTAMYPYRDAHSNTLADLAFNYWVTDLRRSTNMPDTLLGSYRDSSGTPAQNFANPRNDPATWQHMVNFTIGLGLTSYLTQEGLTWDKTVGMYGGSYPALAAGTTLWPEPGADRPANVADLWHAAINSRGQFFSADDPASLSVAFRSALNAIGSQSGASAALSANSTSLTGSTLIYQARFNPDWSGSLRALPIVATQTTGEVGAPAWDAATLIPRHDRRKIFTHNGTGGIDFTSCSTLSTSQKAALDMASGGAVDNRCAERLAWLRGDPANEQRTTTGLRIFRNRQTTVMGDIINSDPAFVKDVDYRYSGLAVGTPGQSTYDQYRSNNASRMAMVYVGANDGHLHAIRGDSGASDSGVEKFSYIPAGVFHNLRHLTDPSYSHRYYVDGSIAVRDVYINGGWKTVLVAGLNAGGKSIYALDVTDPENFDRSKVLWEFNGAPQGQPGAINAEDAADMGLTYSRPQIGILQNGTWVAVFGNGYNSADGGAHLFVVNLATGALLKKITAVDVTGVDDQNGLSTPLLYDANGDYRIDTAYAGDLQGNLWKFDLSGADTSGWVVANNRPLFHGVAGVGSQPPAPQPITAQPKVVGHHIRGQLVLFGTGRYITNDDPTYTNVQSYYGIWDDPTSTSTATRSDLQQQTFDLQASGFDREVRSVTNNTVNWAGGRRGWYLDLLSGTGASAAAQGERVVSTSNVLPGRVLFTTIVPSTDPCTPGGTSWFFALPISTGGAFSNTVLDLNADGKFDGEDTLDPTNRDAEIINAVTLKSLGLSNTSVMIDVDQGDPNSPSRSLAVNTGTGDNGSFNTLMTCSEANEADCNRAPPPGNPGGGQNPVTRRSWIQIR